MWTSASLRSARAAASWNCREPAASTQHDQVSLWWQSIWFTKLIHFKLLPHIEHQDIQLKLASTCKYYQVRLAPPPHLFWTFFQHIPHFQSTHPSRSEFRFRSLLGSATARLRRRCFHRIRFYRAAPLKLHFALAHRRQLLAYYSSFPWLRISRLRFPSSPWRST